MYFYYLALKKYECVPLHYNETRWNICQSGHWGWVWAKVQKSRRSGNYPVLLCLMSSGCFRDTRAWAASPVSRHAHSEDERMKACRAGIARMWNSWVSSVQWNVKTPTQLKTRHFRHGADEKTLQMTRLEDTTHLFLGGPSPENSLSVWAERRGLSALQPLPKSPFFTPDPLRCPFTKEPGI